jgi:hypothetical protein
MTNKQEGKKFYILDYFLDGYFLKCEQLIGEDLPAYGESKTIRSQAGIDINTHVVGNQKISESEYRIFLNSSLV